MRLVTIIQTYKPKQWFYIIQFIDSLLSWRRILPRSRRLFPSIMISFAQWRKRRTNWNHNASLRYRMPVLCCQISNIGVRKMAFSFYYLLLTSCRMDALLDRRFTRGFVNGSVCSVGPSQLLVWSPRHTLAYWKCISILCWQPRVNHPLILAKDPFLYGVCLTNIRFYSSLRRLLLSTHIHGRVSGSGASNIPAWHYLLISCSVQHWTTLVILLCRLVWRADLVWRVLHLHWRLGSFFTNQTAGGGAWIFRYGLFLNHN